MYRHNNSYEEQEGPRKCGKNCIPQETVIYDVKLAHAYVPFQKFCSSFSPEVGLRMGTIFPELFSPYEKPGAKTMKHEKRVEENYEYGL